MVEMMKLFGGVIVVDGVIVSFCEGKVNGLIGLNGLGKMIFFNCVIGMIKLDFGEVCYWGQEIMCKLFDWIVCIGIGWSFQLCWVFLCMIVMENLLVVVCSFSIWCQLCLVYDLEELEWVWGWLCCVGIDYLEYVEVCNFSYGQQKLFELVGVLMGEFDMIMFDELVGGVNFVFIGCIVMFVCEFNEEGKIFIIVEYNMEMVMSLCDYVVVFDCGCLIVEGMFEIIQ